MLVAFEVTLIIFMILFGLLTLGDQTNKDIKSINGSITVVSMLLLTLILLVQM